MYLHCRRYPNQHHRYCPDTFHDGAFKDSFLLVSIITIGLPAGLQSIMYNASNMIVQSSLNSLGTSTMAAYTAFGKIDAIYWMISGAFSVAITTFIGQNFGAGKYKRMKQSITTCLFLDFAATILVTAVLLFSGKFLLQLFTTDPEVIEIGNVLVPMIMTCCGVCILRILWIFLVVPHHPGVTSILLCYPISWGLTTVLFILYYYREQKKFFRVHQED